MTRAIAKNIEEVKALVVAMALCHSVVPEPKADVVPELTMETKEQISKYQRLRRRRHKNGQKRRT